MKLEVKMTKEEFDAAMVQHLGFDPDKVKISGVYVWSTPGHEKAYGYFAEFVLETSSQSSPAPTKEPPSTATSINFSDDIPL